MPKLSVLMSDAEYARFEAYCLETGHKKSSLIVRLVRDYLDQERFGVQQALPFPVVEGSSPRSKQSKGDVGPRRAGVRKRVQS